MGRKEWAHLGVAVVDVLIFMLSVFPGDVSISILPDRTLRLPGWWENYAPAPNSVAVAVLIASLRVRTAKKI